MSISYSLATRRSFKIVLLGNSGVGKTSIIEQFVNNRFNSQQNPTIGIDFMGRTISHKGNNCRIQLWDTAGQERYRSLIPSYLQDADCVLYIFDVTKQQTLAELQKWISLYKDVGDKKSISLICGNKSDLQKKINKRTLMQLMQKYKMPYHAISAKTAENLNQLFHLIIDMILINTKSQQHHLRRKHQNHPEEEYNRPHTEQRLTQVKLNPLGNRQKTHKIQSKCLC